MYKGAYLSWNHQPVHHLTPRITNLLVYFFMPIIFLALLGPTSGCYAKLTFDNNENNMDLWKIITRIYSSEP